MTLGLPHLGHGVGLRREHCAEVLRESPRIDWLEVITENFLVRGGNPRRVLRAARERWPIVLHGVSLSIGGTDDPTRPTSPRSRRSPTRSSRRGSRITCAGAAPAAGTATISCRCRTRARRSATWWGASSACRSGSGAASSSRTSRRTCDSATPTSDRYLATIPAARVGQIHLAGHSTFGELLLDTHDHPVPDAVWGLYRTFVERFGARPTLVEWDEAVPPLAEVLAESRIAATIEADVLRPRRRHVA